MAINPETTPPCTNINEPNPWDQLQSITYNPIPELPTSSPNRTCNFYLREINRLGRMNDVRTFLGSTIDRSPRTFSSDNPAELNQFCQDYSNRLKDTIDLTNQSALKDYSGFNYKTINQVSRGQRNYDLLGAQTPEKLASAQNSINQIRQAIATAPPIETDLITHRGTNLDSFQGYNINSLSELKQLQGQFFLETGFTSTSLCSDDSFANHDFDDPLRPPCNISIEYFIPKENHEVIGLLSHATSYNPEQHEILIDQDSLSYISNVEISPDKSSAKLQMTLIPREIYDPAMR